MIASTSADAARTITVLQSIDRPGDRTNPYLVQLFAALPATVHVEYFSMRRALLSRFDVFHVHWPEYLVRHRTPFGTLLKQACAALLLLRLRLARVAVVRTLHNDAPHETGSRRERLLLAWLDRLTVSWIRLNPTTAARAPDAPVILHGHYRDWYAKFDVPESVRGRLLYFGLIRGYKGLDTLIDAMRALAGRDSDATLRIVGNPATAEMRGTLEATFAGHTRIGGVLAYVGDDVLAREIGEAELVVLPYQRMHNSGALLLALSLARPVLVPWSAANAALADEVGEGWVCMYQGELTAVTIADALQALRSRARATAPLLSRRDWPALGAQHRDAYLSALRRVHATGPRE